MPYSSPKLSLPCLIGRGSRSKVCSSCRRCVLRVSNGLPARSGATRAAKPPKTERGTFPTKQACRKTAALGFPPPAGVAPYIGFAPAGRGGALAPRLRKIALCCGLDITAHDQPPARPSAILAAAGTQRGRCEGTSRWPRESFARPLGARRDDDSRSCGRRARRGRLLVARRVDRAIRVFSVDRVGKHR